MPDLKPNLHLAAAASAQRAEWICSLICRAALVAAATSAVAWAHAQPTPQAVSTRGELLYANHCIECHTTEMHWRVNRRAVDWDTLRFQVRRWQGLNSLGWTETDVNDVARYLNDTIYQFPRQVSGAGHRPGAVTAAVPLDARR